MDEECESIADWLAGKAARARLQAYALVERELREVGIDLTLTDAESNLIRHTSLLAAVESRKKQP